MLQCTILKCGTWHDTLYHIKVWHMTRYSVLYWHVTCTSDVLSNKCTIQLVALTYGLEWNILSCCTGLFQWNSYTLSCDTGLQYTILSCDCEFLNWHWHITVYHNQVFWNLTYFHLPHLLTLFLALIHFAWPLLNNISRISINLTLSFIDVALHLSVYWMAKSNYAI